MLSREDNERLVGRHKVLAELLISGGVVHYIDVPMYLNIGDHLIAHGTYEFFRKNNITITRSSGIHSYDKKWIDEADILVFAGGGNFGDLWIDLHKARLALINDAIIKGKRIVILPQTVYYGDERNFRSEKEIFKGYNNIYFFARDMYSYEYVKGAFLNCYLAPDMAHHLYDVLSFFRGDFEGERCLNFFRKDSEKNCTISSLTNHDENIDWEDLLSRYKLDVFLLRKTFNLYRFLGRRGISCLDKNLLLWRICSWRVVINCCKYLSSYSEIRTDRLHMLILSLLLGKQVTYYDNSYGKLSRYANCWLNGECSFFSASE